MQKAKENNTKVTGCIEAALAFSWIETCRHFAKDTSFNMDVNYQLTVNLRPYLDPPISYNTMSPLFTSYITRIKSEVYNGEPEHWRSKFWQTAREKTEELQESLKNKIIASKEYLRQSGQTLATFSSKLQKSSKDLYCVFAVSNIGEFSSDSGELIAVEDIYTTNAFFESDRLHIAFNSLSTVNGRLCWLISYNGLWLRNDVVEFWALQISNLIEKFAKA